MPDVKKQERVVLSRAFSEFLVELSIALHRHSMYPSGHPSLGPTVDAVLQRATRLLRDRSSLVFGVARRQLIIEGVTTDPNQPVLRRLAESLHGHHLGAVTIVRGVQSDEVAEALRALAAEPEREGPIGLKREGPGLTWPHLKLHPLTFDGLALVGDAPMSAGKGDVQGAELWVGLARAALSVDEVDSSADVPTEPSVLARAIDDHPTAAAYDQVIVGYLLQIAHELKSTSGAEAAALRTKTSALIASLRPETLRRLVEMGGDAAQRGQFVLDATHGMAVDAVLEIVKAAAEANGQTISHGLVRMLSKLAAHAETGSEYARARADGELREQVAHLLSDWQLEDPNPEVYGRVLQHMATSAPSNGRRTTQGSVSDPGTDSLRVVQMSLESAVFGPLVERALDHIVRAGRVSAVHALLASCPDGSDEVAEAILSTLAEPAMLRTSMAREQPDLAALEPLVPHISVVGFEVLLDALTASEVRATRRRLLDLLSRNDLDLGAVIAARLDDERWYVQRNMLTLLERSGRVPDGFSVTPWTSHPDVRVRYAALRVQLTLPNERDLAICRAIVDVDQRLVALGLAAVQHECPPIVAQRVAELALHPEVSAEIRLLATKALGQVRQVLGLDALLKLSHAGRTLLGRPKLPPATPVLVAAIGALAKMWAADPRAASVLAAAARSSDPEVREAARAPGR